MDGVAQIHLAHHVAVRRGDGEVCRLPVGEQVTVPAPPPKAFELAKSSAFSDQTVACVPFPGADAVFLLDEVEQNFTGEARCCAPILPARSRKPGGLQVGAFGCARR